MQGIRRSFIAAVLASGLAPPHSFAQADIPTLKSVVGHTFGAQITAPRDVITYFQALAAAAPERMRLVEYGTSWEGRPLIYAIIASEETMDALDDLQGDIQDLADPRTLSATAAKALIDDLPAPVWLSYGVHGNEISSSDAAMRTAYTLLSAENDADVEQILDNTIVFLDPMQNPDGRNRFVHNFYTTLGLEPSGSAIAAERNEPWPNGRTNHYLFDMNRDWFALTQPETRARVKAYLDWMPTVFVDLHEMGSNSTYYFSPEAEPFNPYITQSQIDGLLRIGKGNAKAFDAQGLEYYTREVFDAHYPGYGAGWPLFHGGIGTTYEQSSARGLKADRDDGTVLTYADSVNGHFTTSMATLKTVAAAPQVFLQTMYDNRRSAIDSARSADIASYIIPAQTDQSAADKLARLLSFQGVEVAKRSSSFKACGASYRPGSYTVSLAQPAGRLARTLLDSQVDVDPAFMEEQERRRAKGMSVEFYDVTAWSLPKMYNVDIAACDAALKPASRDILSGDTLEPASGVVNSPNAAFGFIAPWGDTAGVRLLSAALRAGVDVRSIDKSFAIDGRTYPAGSLVFQRSRYEGDLQAFLVDAAGKSGATVYGIADSWVDDGPNFGSDNAVRHRTPKIALAWGAATDVTAAGATRYVIERQLGFPTVPVRARHLRSDYLAQFDVLVLPEGGGYKRALGESGAKALAGWVSRGGTLIALGSATRYVAHPKSNLSALRRELDAAAPKAEDDDPALVEGSVLETPAALESVSQPLEAVPDFVLGSLVRTQTNLDHWMAAGLKPALHALAEGRDIYRPLRQGEGVTIASFAGPDTLVASGYVWADVAAQMAYKPFITLEEKGRGFVISFTQSPTTRGYLDGLNVALANALFRAPAHASKIP